MIWLCDVGLHRRHFYSKQLTMHREAAVGARKNHSCNFAELGSALKGSGDSRKAKMKKLVGRRKIICIVVVGEKGLKMITFTSI
jgi:hypothetical protein